MGNRAVITTRKKEIGVYLHWNGGRDSVEGFLTYCSICGFRPPEKDCYGWARLCQVIANFFGPDGLSVGIDRYDMLDTANGDNGVYVIENWNIVERLHYPWDDEQNNFSLEEMLLAVDSRQPLLSQLGEAEILKRLSAMDDNE